MVDRQVEDLLRAEYFELLPELRRVQTQLETQIRCALLSFSTRLTKFERLEVKSRIKDCESAIKKLLPETGIFDPERASSYTLKGLDDMVGVRVLSFPAALGQELNNVLRKEFPDWVEKPFHKHDRWAGFKYIGKTIGNREITAEYQVLSALVGAFWDVEHSAIYKPTPELRGAVKTPAMRAKRENVMRALLEFETAFVTAVRERDSSR